MLDPSLTDLIKRKIAPGRVIEALANAYLPKEPLLTADNLEKLARELCMSGADPEVIGAFVVRTAQEHRITYDLQRNLPSGHGVPPHFYVAGVIADGLYGGDLETRMRYASFHLQELRVGRKQNDYAVMRDCLGRYSAGLLGLKRDWTSREILPMAKKLSLVSSPTEGHKLVHAFRRLLGLDQETQEATCFDILKPEFKLGDLFASYIQEAFYDFAQLSGAWGVYDELKEAIPLFAKTGLTPKDAALGIMKSDFHARFMIGVMRDLGFDSRQIRKGIAQALSEYVDDTDNAKYRFSLLEE